MRTGVQSLASLSELRIQHCHELQCRLQMRLRSGIAMAVLQAGSCSSDLTPSLGTSIYLRCDPRENKQTNKKKNSVVGVPLWHSGLRIQGYQCSGLGHCCGAGLIPGPISTCCRHGQKKKTKNKKTTTTTTKQNKKKNLKTNKQKQCGKCYDVDDAENYGNIKKKHFT